MLRRHLTGLGGLLRFVSPRYAGYKRSVFKRPPSVFPRPVLRSIIWEYGKTPTFIGLRGISVANESETHRSSPTHRLAILLLAQLVFQTYLPSASAGPQSRETLLANPLLARQPILFVVRHQYARDHHNTGTMFHPGEINAGSFRGGGAIRTIDFGQGGKVTTLWESSRGVARDPDVRFDGKRIVFAMRPDGSKPYHIFEMNADGGDLRQLTFGPHASDIDPCYLPDGRIVFASTRDPKYCGCNRHIQANLFVMDADGPTCASLGETTCLNRVRV